MKQILQILLFFVSMTTAKATDDYAVALIPDSLKKNASAVVRQDIGIYEVKTPFEATYKLKMAVTIFKESHPYSIFPVGYDKNSKIKNLKARYYDATGKLIRKVEKDEIRDVAGSGGGTLYTDARAKYVENQYGVLPYTFEIEYEVEYYAIRQYPNWSFQIYGVGVQYSEFTLIMPKNIGLNHHVVNADFKAIVEDKGANKSFYWSMSNLKVIEREPFMPTRRDLLPYLELSPERFGIDKLEGSMKDWASFGKFMAELNAGRDEVSPAMATKIKEMTANCKTNVEKIDTLYRYMQQTMRYVSVQLGIGGWQTFDAKYVEKNKFGDCKALSNFMKSMLKVVGIEGQLVVVSAGDDDFFDPDPAFCLPRFNHMILHIPSENMWLDKWF